MRYLLTAWALLLKFIDSLIARMMVENQRRSGRSLESEKPIVVNRFKSASPSQPDETGLSQNPASGGISNSSMITKLGPQDYCGFEIDPPGRSECPASKEHGTSLNPAPTPPP
jgi:hypothetical protein